MFATNVIIRLAATQIICFLARTKTIWMIGHAKVERLVFLLFTMANNTRVTNYLVPKFLKSFEGTPMVKKPTVLFRKSSVFQCRKLETLFVINTGHNFGQPPPRCRSRTVVGLPHW